MRRTIHKWFWGWNFDREEEWLNHMAAQGLALVAVGFCRYTFEECLPGEYAVRLELMEQLPESAEGQQYLRFIEETGAEYLGAIARWAYFRKRTERGGFDLFSDLDSRLAHLKRILVLFIPFIFLNLWPACWNLSLFLQNRFWLSLFCSVLGAVMVALLTYGFFRIWRKRRRLLQERSLHE